MTQRQIAQLTGQSPSEVCEILKDRKVRDVWLLERIADGLGIPRARMGLSYGEQGLDPSSVKKEVDEERKRRALLAATWAAALGQAFLGVGELTKLALPTGQTLPSRLDMSHVHAVRAVTDRLVSFVLGVPERTVMVLMGWADTSMVHEARSACHQRARHDIADPSR